MPKSEKTKRRRRRKALCHSQTVEALRPERQDATSDSGGLKDKTSGGLKDKTRLQTPRHSREEKSRSRNAAKKRYEEEEKTA